MGPRNQTRQFGGLFLELSIVVLIFEDGRLGMPGQLPKVPTRGARNLQPSWPIELVRKSQVSSVKLFSLPVSFFVQNALRQVTKRRCPNLLISGSKVVAKIRHDSSPSWLCRKPQLWMRPAPYEKMDWRFQDVPKFAELHHAASIFDICMTVKTHCVSGNAVVSFYRVPIQFEGSHRHICVTELAIYIYIHTALRVWLFRVPLLLNRKTHFSTLVQRTLHRMSWPLHTCTVILYNFCHTCHPIILWKDVFVKVCCNNLQVPSFQVEGETQNLASNDSAKWVTVE